MATDSKTMPPTVDDMANWLESYFDCDDLRNNCPEPKWAKHIRDVLRRQHAALVKITKTFGTGLGDPIGEKLRAIAEEAING